MRINNIMLTLNGTTYYTTAEIAKKIGVHKLTINRWVKEGRLIPHKFGVKKFYFTESSIEKCIKGENIS